MNYGTLNPQLVRRQKLTQEDVNGIMGLHAYRLELFRLFKKVPTLPTEDINELVLELEDTEFIMQSCWKFKEDRNLHTWWKQVPFCTCKDCNQKFGNKKVIEYTCKVHGKLDSLEASNT